jgi:hypothetical protein
MKREHALLNIEGNATFVSITIKDDIDEDLSAVLHKFLHSSLKYDQNKRVFMLKTKNLDSFLSDIDSIVQEFEKQTEESEEESEESSSSSSDDSEEDKVLIQQALARRLEMKSRQDIIDTEVISESEHESVITHSRRIRFLLQEIKALKARVAKLEQQA